MTPSRLAAVCVVLSAAAGRAAEFDAAAPVLIKRCLECHAGAKPAGELDLTTRQGALAALTPGKPDASRLIERVAKGEMPPKKQGQPQPLPAAEVDALKRWVAAGAPWPAGRRLDPFEVTTDKRAGRDWWSLQAISAGASPAARGANVIDAFVQAKLAERGWVQAPPADRRTLVRRVHFDLVGLPPTFAEVEAFVADPDPLAYERLVDRLLASPKFGERWGRHWLDVARYAETCGYERDQVKPGIWKYRDWVVRAVNDDMPFARFVAEQLAGDELPDRTESSVIATGFLRLGTWNDEPNDPEEYKYERLEDMVGAATAGFLALTVKCARCHDHKFDAITQADYYRVAAAFWPGPIDSGDRTTLGGPDAKALGYNVHGWTDRGPAAPPLRLLVKGDPKRPGPVVEPGPLSCVPALNRPVAAPPAGAKTTTRRLQLAGWIADPKNPLAARVWVNRLWQHHFGHGLVRSPDNFGFTGERPAHPELLDWLAAEFLRTGGRSKPLHRLILLSQTYRQSSLHPRQDEYAASDAGNRVWWRAERRRLDAEALRDSLLFAAGRLDTGRVGGPSFAPTIGADALEGLSMKGAAWKASPPEQQRRRSLYVFAKRSLLLPLATAFDFPDTTLPCAKRDVTTVPTQALALLNNAFIHEQSEALAARLHGSTDTIGAAWRAALGRDPRPSERAAAAAHLRQQADHFRAAGRDRADVLALASLCHVLLNTNEFVYVD